MSITRNNSTQVRILVAVAVSMFAVIFCTASYANADDISTSTAQSILDAQASTRVDTLKQNISNHQDEIQKLEAEIAEYKNKLTDVGNQKNSLQGQIKTIDLTRSKITADTRLTQVKISNTSETISSLSQNISQKQERILRNKSIISDIIHKIDQYDANNLIETILSSASISDVIQDIDDLSRLQVSARDNIKSLEQLKTELGTQKSSFESQQRQLISLKAQLADQKQLADQQRQEQARLLAETKNQESNYKKVLADKEARKKQFEREIDNYEAQLRAVIDLDSFPRPGTKVLVYPTRQCSYHAAIWSYC